MTNFRVFKQQFNGKWAVMWTLDGEEYTIMDPITLRYCRGDIESAKKCFTDPHIEHPVAPVAEQDLTGFVKPVKTKKGK